MQTNYNRNKELLQKAKTVRIISNFEMVEELKNKPPLQTIKTDSFPELNKAIEGFTQGELIVITGNTGCGKTLLCHSLTNDFCDDGHAPLWLSYEVPPRYFVNKFSVLNQFYLPEELEPYSIVWITEVVNRAIIEKGVDVVFIDHLHYVYDITRGNNTSIDIGYIVRSLKRLAVESEIIIFLICHTTKTKIDSVDDIGLHRIRDSSLVAQESDTAIFVHREEVNNGISTTNEAYVKVCKARRTGVMSKVIPVLKIGEFLKELTF